MDQPLSLGGRPVRAGCEPRVIVFEPLASAAMTGRGIRLRMGVRSSVMMAIVLTFALAEQAGAATITDLGTLIPAAVNARQVVGNIFDSNLANPVPHAALWSNGVLTALPEQSGATQSDALAINQAGRIVGDDTVPAQTSSDTHAVFWNGLGAPTQIGPLASFGPGSDFSQATAVDAAGDVVGFTVGPSQRNFSSPASWPRTAARPRRPAGGSPASSAHRSVRSPRTGACYSVTPRRRRRARTTTCGQARVRTPRASNSTSILRSVASPFLAEPPASD